MHHAVYMRTLDWLKIWLKKIVFLNKCVLMFFAPKTKHYQMTTLKRGLTVHEHANIL